MKCKTIKGYDVNGKPTIGHKIPYDTRELAQIEADRQNSHPKAFILREVYKCNKCKKYHVGKSLKLIPNKEAKPRKDKFRSINLKIVGSIDLSQFIQPKKNKIDLGFDKRESKHKIGIQVTQAKLNEIDPTVGSALLSRKKFNSQVKKGVVGGFRIDGALWRYYKKEKTFKVITPSGRVRFIKLEKIFGKSSVNRHMIMKYITQNHIELENGK